MPTLRVPHAHRPALEDLARLSNVEVENLVQYFAKISPAHPQIFENIQDECGLAPDSARLLVAALGGLVELKSRVITTALMSEQVAQDRTLELNDEERKRLDAHLRKLIEAPAVARVAKAMVLQVEHSNIFRDVRMFSDFRPVLDEPLSADPSAVIVSHTLKIEYIDQSERVNKLFVVLDAEDLKKLYEVVEREVKKQEALDGFAERMNLSRFDFWGGV